MQRISSRARDMQPIWGVSDLSDNMACKEVQALALHGSRKKIWDKKKSPLWNVSLHISLKLTKNCESFLRIKWELYFYKEVFHSFIEFHKSCMRVYNSWSPSTHCQKHLELLRFGLVSLFNGISTLFRLFNAKAILLEEH